MVHYLNHVFDLFLPQFCINCSAKVSIDEKFICSICYKKIELASVERIRNEFDRKFQTDRLISDFNSAYVFHNDSEIQNLIHALKYDQNYLLGIFLGKKISSLLSNKIMLWNADLIIPIPLHNLRKAERGYNQSLEITKGISRETGIRYSNSIMKRNKFTATQTKFTLSERKENISGAFSIKNKKKIIDKKIILVDDVITTGATISECAEVLKTNGAKEVFALSVAIAA